MKVDDIHGTDWRFEKPETKETKIFAYSGWGRTEKKAAEQFKENHPDWILTKESF